MVSMTGFGAGVAKSKEVRVDASVKSVNGRYLEVRVQLPKEYLIFEHEIKKWVTKFMRRGSVSVHVSRTWLKRSAKENLFIDEGWAREWLRAYSQLQKKIKLPSDLTLDKFVELSGCLATAEKIEADPREKKLLFAAIKVSLQKCARERHREGESLRKSLLQIISELEQIGHVVVQRSLSSRDEQSEKLRMRLDKMRASVGIDESRLAQEMVILLDKSDVMEEIVRFKEHLKALRQILSSQESQGKKADFYIQEIFRETNTIGAKSQSAEQTKNVIELKTRIEQLREQIQNIE